MKSILLSVIILINMSLQAQSFLLGINGINAPENLKPEPMSYLADAWKDKPFVFRVRQDKDPLTDAQIQNIVNFSKLVNLQIVYTVNTRPSNPADIVAYNKLKGYNLNITAVELGNEEYAQVAGHLTASDYISKCRAVISTFNANGFTGKYLFHLAPRPVELGAAHGGRNYGTTWNNAVIAEINSNDRYDAAMHIYENGYEIPEIKDYSDENKSLPKADNYRALFEAIYLRSLTNDLISVTLTYAKTKMPTKKVWLTEFGYVVNSGNLSNTFGFELARLYGLQQLEAYDNVAVVCIHAGLTTTGTAFINTKKRQDLGTSEYIKRLGYYTLSMYLNKKPGDEFVYNLPNLDGQFINATASDEGSGVCSWWLDTRPASYAISGISNKSSELSYGYVSTIAVEDTVICDTTQVPEIVYADTTIQIPAIRYEYKNVSDTNYIKVIQPLYICGDDTVALLKTQQKISNRIDTVPIVYQKDTVINIPKVVYSDSVSCIIVPKDSVPEQSFQALDADTLIFNNETEFRDFLFHYGLASNYEVKPPTFDQTQDFWKVLPLKYQKWNINGIDAEGYAVDANYYKFQQYKDSEMYLHEELLIGKFFCVIFDHLFGAKNSRLYITYNCDADYRYVDIIITNVATGQTVIFRNGCTWSDRNGQNIFNVGLKTWQIFGFNAPEVTMVDAFQVRMKSTNGAKCNLDFSEYMTGHEYATLYWQKMTETYGDLRIK